MTTPELPPLHWVGAMRIDNASFQSLATEASVYARERILLARIAELEADAARYLWLRDGTCYADDDAPVVALGTPSDVMCLVGDELDAAIDAAREAKP